MKKLSTILAAVALATAALSSTQAVAAGQGLYVMGSVGHTKIGPFKEPGLGLRAGYQFTPTFALEGTYDFYGSAEGAQLTGLNLSTVFRLPLTNSLAMRGLIGYSEFRVTSDGVTVTSGDLRRPLFGFGLEAIVTKRFSVIGDLRATRLEGETLSNFSLGAKYSF